MNQNSDKWLYDCIAGHSAIDILTMLRVLDGEWKTKFILYSVWWHLLKSERQVKQYIRTIEPWTIK